MFEKEGVNTLNETGEILITILSSLAQEEMVALIAENTEVGSYIEEFDEKYRRIAEEIKALKEEQKEARRKKRLAENYEQRVKDMDAFIRESTCQIPEFDNDLVRRLIVNIKVVSADKLLIQF